MRVLVALLIGSVVGACLAAVVLFYNPMSRYAGKAPQGESYFYANDMEHFAISHAGKLPMPYRPSDIEPLWEGAINGVVLTVFPLINEAGDMVAFASRISALGEDSDLLLRGAYTHNDWLLSFAGRGTLFVDDRENLSELVRYGVVPVWLLRQPWAGARDLLATSGPDAGSASVLGGTGEFAGASGRIRQRHRVEQFGPGGLQFESELGLELSLAESGEQVADQR